MSKYKKLFGDSIIYFLGNIGGKVISVAMVSFYSFMLSPEEFGKIDITQTTIALMLPITTLCIHETILRFCLRSSYDRKSLLSTGILLVSISVFASIPICLLMNALNVIAGNVLLIILLVALEGFNALFSQYCRGINKVKLFATAGMILTFVMAASNIVFLKYFRMGINGYFLSLIAGYLVSVLILFFGSGIFKNASLKFVDKQLFPVIIRYSIPLIPNSIMWWIMNAGDKYAIMILLGEEANGFYAIAGKIPMILSTFTSIFMQAWQVSAITESESKDKSIFYSRVFNGLSTLLFLVICCILIVLKPVLSLVISLNYADTWKYVPFLLLGTMFSSFSAFLGMNYLAMAKTSGAFLTTLVGGVMNMILNFVLIYFIGLNGAALATAISFLSVWLLRVWDTKQFVTISIKKRKFFLSMGLIAVQIAGVYLLDMSMSGICGGVVLCILILTNSKEIKEILNKKRQIYGLK